VLNNLITMITVSDMERSVRFYRDTLGLKLRFQSPDWSEFDFGSNTLALTVAVFPRRHRQANNNSPVAPASVSLSRIWIRFSRKSKRKERLWSCPRCSGRAKESGSPCLWIRMVYPSRLRKLFSSR
jgi:hypothetical protein